MTSFGECRLNGCKNKNNSTFTNLITNSYHNKSYNVYYCSPKCQEKDMKNICSECNSINDIKLLDNIPLCSSWPFNISCYNHKLLLNNKSRCHFCSSLYKEKHNNGQYAIENKKLKYYICLLCYEKLFNDNCEICGEESHHIIQNLENKVMRVCNNCYDKYKNIEYLLKD